MFLKLNNMNKILSRRFDWKDTQCDCSYKAYDTVVQSGLSLTPAQVRKLSEKGIAVSTPNANQEGLYDSSSDLSDYSLDSFYERGITREELWERAQVAKTKILNSRDRLNSSQRKTKLDKQKK